MGTGRRLCEPIGGLSIFNHGWHARTVYRSTIYRQAIQRVAKYLISSRAKALVPHAKPLHPRFVP
jgi:hypothetical protein